MVGGQHGGAAFGQVVEAVHAQPEQRPRNAPDQAVQHRGGGARARRLAIAQPARQVVFPVHPRALGAPGCLGHLVQQVAHGQAARDRRLREHDAEAVFQLRGHGHPRERVHTQVELRTRCGRDRLVGKAVAQPGEHRGRGGVGEQRVVPGIRGFLGLLAARGAVEDGRQLVPLILAQKGAG